MPRRLCNVTLLAAAGRAGTKKISFPLVRVLGRHVTQMAEFLGLVLDLQLFNIGLLGNVVMRDDCSRVASMLWVELGSPWV